MSAAKAVTAAARTPMVIMDVLKQAKAWSVGSFFSTKSTARIDNAVFTLHSTITVMILTISMVFVGMKQYFGEPIECLNTVNGAAGSLTQAQMQHYCWMEGAFTIVTRYGSSGLNHEITGQDNAYPGVKEYKPHKGDLKMPHKYYQWVYYILCIQCLLFYAPKYLWRNREAGRLRDLISKIQNKHVLQYEGLDRFQVVHDTLDILLISNEFFSGILISEVLFLVHLVCEILFLNAFLGGKFIGLGFQWLHYSHHSDDIAFDPLIRVFPRLTKCSFHKFGVSGSIETYDTLCFMPMNIVNEKIFVILWFWFVILLLTTLYHLMFYRVCIMAIPWYRKKRLQSLAPMADSDFIKKISKSPGKWFIMQLLALNMKPYYFKDLLHQLQKDHFAKNFRLSSRVFMSDFIVDGKVPMSSIPQPPAPKPKAPEPGFKMDEKSSQDSGVDKGGSSSTSTDDWPALDKQKEDKPKDDWPVDWGDGWK